MDIRKDFFIDKVIRRGSGQTKEVVEPPVRPWRCLRRLDVTLNAVV